MTSNSYWVISYIDGFSFECSFRKSKGPCCIIIFSVDLEGRLVKMYQKNNEIFKIFTSPVFFLKNREILL